ncbi:MAG: carbohydrate porin [Chlorobi bacterium]|nr:carbohydrate porin [Chlorobiota bacterium]
MSLQINVILILFLFTAYSGFSQKNEKSSTKPVKIGILYINDNLINVSGGIKAGYNYLGYANVNISINTQNANLWKGGKILIHPASTHGGEPSANLIGDYQGASNIEAGNHLYMHELWYKQKIRNLNFIIGLQDLNANFAKSSIGENFINSSFGIHSIFSENLTTPIFPLTAPGFSMSWKISKKFVFQSSVFDGKPIDFENNPYNLKWQLDKKNGVLTIHEIKFSNVFQDKLKGTYKIGIFLHTKNVNKNALKIVNGDTVFVKHSDYGLYVNADQVIYKNNEKKIGAFLQLGFCPEKLNHNSRYTGGGINFYGIFNNKNNSTGIAFARSKLIFNNTIHETSIELNYKTLLLKNIFLQPDVQHIIHPSGTSRVLKNAFLFSLRIIWETILL